MCVAMLGGPVVDQVCGRGGGEGRRGCQGWGGSSNGVGMVEKVGAPRGTHTQQKWGFERWRIEGWGFEGWGFEGWGLRRVETHTQKKWGFERCGSKGGGSKGGGLEWGHERVGGPKFRAVFSFSRSHFRSFCVFLGVFSWFFGCERKRRGRQMCSFGVLWLSCEAPAAPKPPGFHTTTREPKRTHLRVPAFKKPPKNEKTPRERTKSEISDPRRKKKARNFGLSGGRGGPGEGAVLRGAVLGRGGPGEGGPGEGAGRWGPKTEKERAPTLFYFGPSLVVENQFLEPAKGVPRQGQNMLNINSTAKTPQQQKHHTAKTPHGKNTRKNTRQNTQHPATPNTRQHPHTHHPPTTHHTHHTQKPTTNTSATVWPKSVWPKSVWPKSVWPKSVLAKLGVGQSRFWPKSVLAKVGFGQTRP